MVSWDGWNMLKAPNTSKTGWWFGTLILFFCILGISSSQLTNSYFSEGLKPSTRKNIKTYAFDSYIKGSYTVQVGPSGGLVDDCSSVRWNRLWRWYWIFGESGVALSQVLWRSSTHPVQALCVARIEDWQDFSLHRKNVEPQNPLTGAYLPCCGDQGALKALFLGRTQRSSTLQPLVQSASTPIPRSPSLPYGWLPGSPTSTGRGSRTPNKSPNKSWDEYPKLDWLYAYLNIDSVQFRTVQSSNNPDFVNSIFSNLIPSSRGCPAGGPSGSSAWGQKRRRGNTWQPCGATADASWRTWRMPWRNLQARTDRHGWPWGWGRSEFVWATKNIYIYNNYDYNIYT